MTTTEKIQRVISQGVYDAKQAAAMAGLQHRWMCKKLQREGTTFTDLRTEYRVNLAKELLAEGKSNLCIAAELGFDVMKDFYACWKYWTGVSWTEFSEGIKKPAQGGQETSQG